MPFKSFHLLCKSGFAEACVLGQSKARSMMLELMCGAWAFFASSSCMAPRLLKRRNTQTHTSGNLYVHLVIGLVVPSSVLPSVVNSRENLMVVVEGGGNMFHMERSNSGIFWHCAELFALT